MANLAVSPTTTILPITDPERALEFYRESLGLPYLGTDAEGTLHFGLAHGAQLGLLPKPAGAQSENTMISFEVAAIEDVIRELEDKGVQFADYDLPDLHTVDHVCVLGAQKAAWFTDPDGNILCLHESG